MEVPLVSFTGGTKRPWLASSLNFCVLSPEDTKVSLTVHLRSCAGSEYLVIKNMGSKSRTAQMIISIMRYAYKLFLIHYSKQQSVFARLV